MHCIFLSSRIFLFSNVAFLFEENINCNSRIFWSWRHLDYTDYVVHFIFTSFPVEHINVKWRCTGPFHHFPISHPIPQTNRNMCENAHPGLQKVELLGSPWPFYHCSFISSIFDRITRNLAIELSVVYGPGPVASVKFTLYHFVMVCVNM